MEEARQRTLRIVLLVILALIVFWLVLRFWHMREPVGEPKRAALRTFYVEQTGWDRCLVI